MEPALVGFVPKFCSSASRNIRPWHRPGISLFQYSSFTCHRSIFVERELQTRPKRQKVMHRQTNHSNKRQLPQRQRGMRFASPERESDHIEIQLLQGVYDRQELSRNILGAPAFPSKRKCDSSSTFISFSKASAAVQTHHVRTLPGSLEEFKISEDELSNNSASKRIHFRGVEGITVPFIHQLSAEHCRNLDLDSTHIQVHDSENLPQNLKKQARIVAEEKDPKATAGESSDHPHAINDKIISTSQKITHPLDHTIDEDHHMTSDTPQFASETTPDSSPARHRPLVVGLTKPPNSPSKMTSSDAAAAFNAEIQKNVDVNTKSAAPAEETPAESSQPKQKKEKAPKQSKPQKAAPAAAPTSPALIDLRVGHILRAITHPNADSLYVSTIAMGDPEGTEHTQVDEETGKVVRTVCSGLNGLIPLAEMQDRKIIVVANLKPVNMRSIKSAAMVLAASPKQEEGADPHAADRVVELVIPPADSEAGDKVYFEGWSYGEGKGPEKQLNPKKKQWEAIQPGFYTSDDLLVGFDASKCDDVEGGEKGTLVVEGKGACKVKTLKGAVVR